jgi:serine/threonine-protein kinase
MIISSTDRVQVRDTCEQINLGGESNEMSVSRVGQTIRGRYLIQSKIGEGGQSAVYKARDIRDGHDVALKILHETMAHSPDARERMSREVRALVNLARAPAALLVYDQCWTDDACMCLVTELLTGKDLVDYLAQHGERLPMPELIRLLGPVVETLDRAHAQGVVHRDLKPENIFVVTNPPGVRLLDFGFAKFTRLSSLTLDGSVAGSPRYMAPEVWLGRKDLDARIDVYALGALIFRCLTGRTPFQVEGMLRLLKLVTEAPRPSLHALRPDLPPEIDDWLQMALAIDREERFQNVRALWEAFVSVAK